MRVTVHKNLRTKKWSVCEATPTGKRGKLIKHLDELTLEDVTFVIPSQTSWQRIVANIADKSKSAGREVIAYAVGELVFEDADPCVVNDTVEYHIKESRHFTNDFGRVISDRTYFRMYFMDGGEVVAL